MKRTMQTLSILTVAMMVCLGCASDKPMAKKDGRATKVEISVTMTGQAVIGGQTFAPEMIPARLEALGATDRTKVIINAPIDLDQELLQDVIGQVIAYGCTRISYGTIR